MTHVCTHSNIVTYQRYDPTRTTELRNAFSREMKRRFNELIRAIRQAVYEEDCFGLNPMTFQNVTTPGRKAFNFVRSQDKMAAFDTWLNQQIDKGILQKGGVQIVEIPQLGGAVEGAWTNRYIYDSYKRGVIRARYELQKAGFGVPSIEQTGGIEISMSTPFHIDRLGLLYTRVYKNLEGITKAMDTQISQILAQGLADGDGPRLLARKMVAAIDGTGMGKLGLPATVGRRFIPAKRRAEILARTEVIRAHHVATIQEYRNWAVEGVVVKAEWKTAGDDRVCPDCQPLEGEVFKLDEVEKMIPYHPQCRCIALPYKTDERLPEGEQTITRDNVYTQGATQYNYANLSQRDLKAMAEYQSGMYNSKIGGFTTIQNYLRNNTIANYLSKQGVTPAKVQGYVDDISSAISKSVTAEEGMVYRGVRDSANVFGIMNDSQLKAGLRYTDKGFVSTTSSQTVARKFSTKLNKWEDPKILRIHLKKGQAAFPMDVVEGIGEKEVVLPHGSRFEVIKVSGKYVDVKIIR